MKTYLLLVLLFAASVTLRAGEAVSREPLPRPEAVLRSGELSLSLNAEGQMQLQSGDGRAGISTLSELDGMKPIGKMVADFSKPGCAQFKRVMERSVDGASCVVIDRFSVKGDAIRWEVEVEGRGAPFGCAVSSKLGVPASPESTYWTTWGSAASEPEIKALIGEEHNFWDDPFQFVKLNSRRFEFGGTSHEQRDAMSIPLFVVGDAGTNRAVMLAHGVDEKIVNMYAEVSPEGAVNFVRYNRRVEKEKPFSYVLFIRPEVTDWRPALGWFRNQNLKLFKPKTAETWMIAGNGAYSEYEGELDAYQMLRSGLQFNWKCGLDYFYMGMFLPKTNDLDYSWTNARFQGAEMPSFPTSLRNLANYSKKMRADGFHVLNYMNPAELGLKIGPFAAAPQRKAKRDEDLWRDANDFVFYKLRDAVLFPKDAAEPYKAWEESVLMDVGVPSYQAHLIEQNKMHLEYLPDSSGVCFDRTDYLRFFNWKRDDGFSWVSDAPCGSLAFGWIDFMEKIGPLFQEKGKAIYCNPLYRRIDLYENIDGYYDEMGYGDCHSISICSFLALDKPYVGWTWGLPARVPLDEYFQRYLYMGAYLTAPMPFNNHTIKPGIADQMYVDYGQLFESLRFRKWNLEERPVEVEGAKANCFEIPGGLLIPVVLGGNNEAATLTVKSKNPVMAGSHFVEILHPGETEWKPLLDSPLQAGGALRVPLRQGCAMVRIVHTKLTPSAKAFMKSASVEVKSALPSTKVFKREKLGDAWTGLEELKAPLLLTKTSHLQFAVRDARGKLLEIFEKEWVRCSPPSPAIIPEKGMIFQEKKVEIRVPAWAKDATVRYTLDGSEPTDQSPLYFAPIVLKQAAEVRARMFLHGETSGVSKAVFTAVPPPPRFPDLYLADLPALKETVGVPGTTVQRNLAWSKSPLSLLGTIYQKGMGVCAVSDLIYEAKPEYKRFVAFVGIDDAMKDFPAAGVKFQVYGDVRDGTVAAEAIAGETLLYETDVMRPNTAAGVDVAIPDGIKRIRLHVTDEGSIDGDHADWVNAGFVIK